VDKEKNMTALRRALLTLAAVLTVSATAPPAFAQLSCALSAVVPLVRVEGLTEYIGDMVLTCTGGTPTADGALIPVDNFAVSITDTNITSRLLNQNLPSVNGGYPYVESTLIINEAFPKSGAASPAYQNPNSVATPAVLPPNPWSITQSACPTSNQPGACDFLGNGYGGWGNDGSDDTSSYGAANTQNGQTPYNVFQGYQLSNHTVRFDGVPVDAPGSGSYTVGSDTFTPYIIFRFTNIRIDATPFASVTPTSGFGPEITATLSVTGTQPVLITSGTTQFVAAPAHTLKQVAVSVTQSLICQGCGTAASSDGATGPYKYTTFSYYVQENFAAAFEAQTWYYNDASPYIKKNPPTGYGSLHTAATQDVLGYPYFTASNFYPDGDPDLTSLIDAAEVGAATNGLRIVLVINNLSPGVTVEAPAVAGIYGGFSPTRETSIDSAPDGFTKGSVFPSSAPVSDPVVGGQSASGVAILLGAVTPNGSVTADYAGSGTFYAFSPLNATIAAAAPNQPIQFVYEIMYADAGTIETLWVPFNIADCNLVTLPLGPPVIATAQAGVGPISNGQYTSGSPNNVASNAVPGEGDYSFPRFVWGAAGNPLPAQNVWDLDNLTCSHLVPITVSPTELQFGSQGLDSPTTAKTVTVTNYLTEAITSLSFTINAGGVAAAASIAPSTVVAADFSQTTTTCGSSLGAHDSCTISIQFDPQATGARSATLSFSGAPDDTQPTVTLKGTGELPVALSTGTMAFGGEALFTPTAAKTVTVTNNTSSAITSFGFSVTGTDPGDFSPPTAATTCGATLGAHSSCKVTIQFDPQAAGPRSAMLTFSGTPDATQPSVALTGTGK
jgi:hypothetical protein